MGIEPTCVVFATPHNGFEDRGRHQADSHLPNEILPQSLEKAGTFV